MLYLCWALSMCTPVNRALKIITWNYRSIRTKMMELANFLCKNNIDICILSETWLSNRDSFNVNSYNIYSKVRWWSSNSNQKDN